MFIFLQLQHISNRKRCSEHSNQSTSQQWLLHNTPEFEVGVINEHEIRRELQHLLQNDDLSVSIQETEWRELLQSVAVWLKRNEHLRKKFQSEAVKKTTHFCQPHKHIFFLKTHKTASSTIMNILFRFGESHNLTFAFPYKSPQFLYPRYFNAFFVEGFAPESNMTFDIMCHHMRFLLTEVKKVMPSDTFYFTILRNPVYLMESSYIYYKASESFSKAKSLEDFLNNTSKYYKNTSWDSSFSRNLMTFDLGFDHNGLKSAKHYQLTCRMVEDTFNLVLITDYFDESLVLLKNALCWTFDDVLSVPLNSRSNSTRKALSLETQERIKSWNQLDWQLYVYFNRSFWDQVEKFGIDRMQREVEELRRRRAQISEICLQDEVDPDKIKDKSLKPFQAGLAKILGYNLKPGLGKGEQQLCQRLVTPELQYSALLLNNQRQKHSKDIALITDIMTSSTIQIQNESNFNKTTLNM